MKNIIKINEVEYIKKSVYDKLKEKKVSKPKKKELDLNELKEYAIIDQANICGIFPFIKRDSGKVDELNTPMGFFKKINKKDLHVLMKLDNFHYGNVVEIHGSTYSFEHIKKIYEMGNIWFNDFEVYMVYDKRAKKFVKNQPLMIVYGGNMCFILAPRIEE